MWVALDLINKIDLSDTVTVCADKGCDSEALRAYIKQAGRFNNISRKQNTKLTHKHMDCNLYKARYLVVNTFTKLKNYRAVVTIFDKLGQIY